MTWPELPPGVTRVPNGIVTTVSLRDPKYRTWGNGPELVLEAFEVVDMAGEPRFLGTLHASGAIVAYLGPAGSYNDLQWAAWHWLLDNEPPRPPEPRRRGLAFHLVDSVMQWWRDGA